MSGFAAGVRFRSSKLTPRKCLIINGWNWENPKPDRITVGLGGWNQEPYFSVNGAVGLEGQEGRWPPNSLGGMGP
jgi:hypothetical protein